jgi:hypothetical protein
MSNQDILNKFDIAFHNNDLINMEKCFTNSPRNNYYLDISLENGNTSLINFFLAKGIQPSLFANQMARINGFHNIANYIDSCTNFRNNINIKNIYYNYNKNHKKFYWDPIIPHEYRF